MKMPLSRKLQEALREAQTTAVAMGFGYTDWEHLLLALARQDGGLAASVLAEAGIDPSAYAEMVATHLCRMPDPGEAMSECRGRIVSSLLAEMLAAAERLADSLGDTVLCTPHALAGLLTLMPCNQVGVQTDMLRLTPRRFLDSWLRLCQGRKARGVLYESQELLGRYGCDLVEDAIRGRLDPVLGRDAELRRATVVLARRSKRNPVFVGQPGVGKTALAHGLALRLAQGDVPAFLRERSLYALDLGLVLAGSGSTREHEQRLMALVRELEGCQGRIMLFLDDLPQALEGQTIIRQALARGELSCVATASNKEYARRIDSDPALARLFMPIRVEEPNETATVSMLRGLTSRLEAAHGLRITDASLTTAVGLSLRLMPDRRLPDKAVDLLDEAASMARLAIETLPGEALVLKQKLADTQGKGQGPRRVSGRGRRAANLEQRLSLAVSRHDEAMADLHALARLKRERVRLLGPAPCMAAAPGAIQAQVDRLDARIADLESGWGQHALAGTRPSLLVMPELVRQAAAELTDVPASRLGLAPGEVLHRLERAMLRTVVGQARAAQEVSGALARGLVGLGDPARPMCCLLFCGPPGVGKSLLAQVVGEALFPSPEHVSVVDMAICMEPGAAMRLMGPPPGYEGHEKGGLLTEAVRRRPFQLLLLEHADKAHPKVLGLLLQLMDEGRLTDGMGRTASFRHAAVILTVSLEAARPSRTHALTRLKGLFAPEFLDRLDALILFRPLSRRNLRRIVALECSALMRRVGERGIRLEISARLVEGLAGALALQGRGARPARRAVGLRVATPLARAILSGEACAGSTVTMDMQAGQISLTTCGPERRLSV